MPSIWQEAPRRGAVARGRVASLGATVPVQVAREFGEKFGIPLREGCGMTEMHGALVVNPRGAEPRLGSIGIPFPYH